MARIRILLVEDEEDTSSVLREALKDEYETMWAANGLEALQMAFERPPDLIVSDINMPVLDGHEFVRRLRAYPQFNGIPVIFLSALNKTNDIKKGYELGAALYLNKPMEPGRFRRNVDLFISDHGVVARQVAGRPPVSNPQASGAAPSAAPAASRAVLNPAPGPRSGPAFEQGVRELKPFNRAAARARVLLVIYDADFTGRLYERLRQEFDPIPARDGMEVIERAARYQPDLFVIDGALPKTNTLHLCLLLKRNPAFKNTPILFLMDPSDGQNLAQIERVGVQGFLQKPVEDEQVASAIQQAVAGAGFTIRPKTIPYPEALSELSRSAEVVLTGSDALRVAQMLRAHAEEIRRA